MIPDDMSRWFANPGKAGEVEMEKKAIEIAALTAMDLADARKLLNEMVKFSREKAVQTPYPNSQVWESAWNEALRMMMCGTFEMEAWQQRVMRMVGLQGGEE